MVKFKAKLKSIDSCEQEMHQMGDYLIGFTVCFI
jgi:hypothetical protein